jgi:prophage regulatory protein
MPEQLNPAPRLLRRQQLEERVALSCSAIYARLDRNSPYFDPAFPRPIKLGNGKRPPVAWVESEVDAYIAARIEASRQAA